MRNPICRPNLLLFGWTWISAIWLIPHHVLAKEFLYRPVTNLASPGALASPRPVAEINGNLIFIGIENGRDKLYRIDGNSFQPLENPNNVSMTTTEVIRFGDELYFAASGPDGIELHATDGQIVRQVGNIAPGTLGSRPSNFQVLNGNLLFHGITDDPSMGVGAPYKYFRSDGTNVEQFPVTNRSVQHASLIHNNRLYFTPWQDLYVTDGVTANLIPSPPLAVDPIFPSIVEAGEVIYLMAGGSRSERGIYRTDGVNVSPVASFASLVPGLSDVVSLFELENSLHVAIRNYASNELIFFRTTGEAPSEVTRWTLPAGFFDDSFVRQPLFSDGLRTYFSFYGDGGEELYEYDGQSFRQLTDVGRGSTGYRFFSAGDRNFVTLRTLGGEYSLYELAAGEINLVGPGMEALVEFEGELFGVSGNRTLWRTENGQFMQVADVPAASAKFLEFDGRLYFGSQQRTALGPTAQLYAISAIPEPASSILLIGSAILLLCAGGRYRVAPIFR